MTPGSVRDDPLEAAYTRIDKMTEVLIRTWMHVHDAEHVGPLTLCTVPICTDIRKVTKP